MQMQSRGAIKFFAIVFALVCLFQLSFTIVTSVVENRADAYADSEETTKLAKALSNGDQIRETYLFDSISQARHTHFLDSMSNEVVYNILLKEYTFKECKEREINLGLDLKGGMNVVLEVKVGDIVNALSGYSQNPVFVEALQLTKEKQKDSQADFVTLFGEAFEEVDPNAKLAQIFNRAELRDRITYNSTNAEVLSVIREETEGAIDRAFYILSTRINQFGVAQPNIQRLASSERILVELPGIKDPERVRKLLQGTAKLEFWETYEFIELQESFTEANARLSQILTPDELEPESAEITPADNTEEGQVIEQGETKETETGEDAVTDLLASSEEQTTDTAASLLDQIGEDTTSNISQDAQFAEWSRENPLWSKLQPAFYQNAQGQWQIMPGATVGYANIKDTASVNYMLRKIKTLFPRDLVLAWTNESENKDNINQLTLIALKGESALDGDVITDARQDYDEMGSPSVSLNMNAEGARTWKRLTGQNIGKQIAIVLDGYVYSHPNVNVEIGNGRSTISGGNMTIEEAQDLSNILKAGKLPAPARIIEEAVVGPSLGQEAINAGLWSFVIAFVLVLFYMILYYNRSGWIADFALVTNIFFIFGVLASLGAVLTLPGIAGIVLTLGMAVDANVIIYERIKEEIRAGKGIRLAIVDGYQKAYSAIVDGNITTLLTGIVLFIFGSGPVQGFATTLIIGILSSLFSAIFISRMIFTSLLNRNRKINFDNARTRDFLANANYNFLGARKKGYIISAIIIVIGIGSLFMNGLNFGVDFTGGRTYIVRFDQDVATNDVRTALTAQFEEAPPEVKTFGPNSQVKITTKYMIENDAPEVDSIIQRKLFDGLQAFFNDQTVGFEDFTADNESENKMVGILSSQKVGPTIADDIQRRAGLAVGFALIVIFLYIAARFRRWQFGLSGVIALFHDTLITISIFSLFYKILPFNMEVDQAFIAAILTIIGYSINDTVIIFDRIREYTQLHPKKELITNMNDALNSTLARTINTSGTTIVVLITIFIFGGEIIRGFTFALLVGVLVGTYSSLFVAAPVAFDLIGKKAKEVVAKATPSKKKK